MAMKEYSTFPKSPKLKPRHRTVESHIQDILCSGGVSFFCRYAVGVFYSHKWLGCLSYGGRFCNQHSESIGQAQHPTIHCGSSSWWHQQNPQKLLNCTLLLKYCKTFDSPSNIFIEACGYKSENQTIQLTFLMSCWLNSTGKTNSSLIVWLVKFYGVSTSLGLLTYWWLNGCKYSYTILKMHMQLYLSKIISV